MRFPITHYSKSVVMMILAIVTSLPLSAWAKRDYRAHDGYLNEQAIIAERGREESDLVIIAPLPAEQTLQERLFNEKLSKEFRDRYEQKFGRTDAERIYYSPNRTTYYNDMYYRGSPQELTDERKRFGDYMIKRLVEYHVEDYMKNDPRGKVLYTIKERVSNVGVQVQKFRFDMRYEIAGNTMDFIVKNPYLDTSKVRLQMSQGALGPGPVEETIVTIAKNITPTVTVESYWVTPITKMSFVVRKALSSTLSTNVSALSGRRDLGARPGSDNYWITEDVYLAGVNYAF
jgi:hypothetical protein